jgi:uncharacterized protein YifE (UPF0438 family)
MISGTSSYDFTLGSRQTVSALSVPPDHLHYRRIPFEPKCDLTHLSAEEQEKLRQYGSWLHALMQRVIKPTTPAQEAFVQCCRGNKRAETELEVLWVRFRIQVLFERAQRMEKSLTDGGREYAEIRKEYARLAKMGHPGAQQWMEQEGPWTNYKSAPDARGGLISHAYDRDSTNTLGRRAHGSFGSKYGPGQGPVEDPNPIEE